MKIIVDKKRINKDKIIIIIPGWKFPEIVFKEFKKEIPQEFGYIHYCYSSDLLNSDPQSTKKNCLRLMEKIEKDIHKLNKIKKRKIYLYAQSLGGIFAAYIADKIDTEKIIYIVPGENLAESFWKSTQTQDLKKEMQRKGHNLKKLKKIWKKISPDHHLKNHAKNAFYLIKLSIHDTIIPYEQGKKLIALLKKRKFKYELKEGFLPHSELCLFECLFPQNSINFFKEEEKN